MENICIIGASTFGVTVAGIASRTGRFIVDGFFDDNIDAVHNSAKAVVLGKLSSITLQTIGNRRIIIAVGNNRDRFKIYSILEERGLVGNLTSLVDPSSHIIGAVVINPGAIIFPGAVVGPFVNIGDCTILNGNCFIGADCQIGAFSNICPGACMGASCEIESGVYIGMRACIIQGVRIKSWSVIGAGAAVINNLEGGKVFAGTPARETSIAQI